VARPEARPRNAIASRLSIRLPGTSARAIYVHEHADSSTSQSLNRHAVEATESATVSDVHDIAVFDDVVLALEVELRRFLEMNLGGVARAAFDSSRQ
jgi:hypothetical protein